jgi:ubiquinone/menaquinone biosynthesis C-methylase UbiE
VSNPGPVKPAAAGIDPDAFRAFEHQGWETVARRYHEGFGEVTPQTIPFVLDAVGAAPGMRVLDVASGPGYGAAAAAARGARAVGVDFAAAMVEQARRLHPGIEFHEGDAEELPFADSEFDAVVMNFGLLHVARPERALREAWRVLRSGGRYAFTVWAERERVASMGLAQRAVEEHGDPDVALPTGPLFYRFSDHAECVRSLEAAGFHHARVREVPLTWRPETPEQVFDVLMNASVRTRGLLRGQAPAALERIRRAVIEGVRGYERGGVIELPMPAVLAAATKP